MPHYKKETGETHAMAVATAEQYHGELTDAGVTFDVLIAFATKDKNGDAVGSALSHGGYPALATVKINSLKARCQGLADALITIDGDRWDEYSDLQKIAVIDHELTHLELLTDGEEGAIQRDDIDRPKLRLRKHDHQFGWFDEIVRRHGVNSIEWAQFDVFRSRALKQLWLPGLGDSLDDAADAEIDRDVARAVNDPNAHGVDAGAVGYERDQQEFKEEVSAHFRKVGILDESQADEEIEDAIGVDEFERRVGAAMQSVCDESGIKLHRNVKVSTTPGGHGVERTKGGKRKPQGAGA